MLVVNNLAALLSACRLARNTSCGAGERIPYYDNQRKPIDN